MRNVSTLFAVLLVALVALPAAAAAAPVTTADGLAAAFAAGDGPITIGDDITIEEPLVWRGSDELVVIGDGHTITAAAGFDVDTHDAMILVTDGADVDIDGLHLAGTDEFDMSDPGGFSGLRVDVPGDATGTVSVSLRDSSVDNVGLHGIYIEDQDAGSAASVRLVLDGVAVTDAGVGGFDQDGVRVNEGGDGDIVFHASDSSFTGAGADGVELDERGAGDVQFSVGDSVFVANGNYCSERFSDGEDGDLIEAEFDDEDGALAAKAAYVDPTCVEVEKDDGVWFAVLDLDDAFDIDEADVGSIAGELRGGVVVDNFDEGLDVDEEDDGGIEVTVTSTLLDGNVDEGIKYTEAGNGSVNGVTRGVTADGDEDDIEHEEAGNGSLMGQLRDSVFDDVELTEEDNGSLSVSLFDLTIDDMEAEQTGAGNGIVRVRRSTYGDTDLDGVSLHPR